MPVTLKTGVMKYRKSDGTYSVMDALMQEPTQDQISAIEAVGQEQVDAVEQKGQDILDSLPEDYTELETDVGELKSALNSMTTATASDEGKALKAKTVSGGKVTEWEFGEAGGIDPEDIAQAVDGWLDDHPEATTTVQDGSITKQKLEATTLVDLNNYVVTPQMYGAKGDGTTDDTLAIQAALDAHSKVYFPQGNYKITSPLTVYYGSTIEGDSKYTATIWAYGCDCIHLTAGDQGERGSVERIHLRGDYTADTNGIKLAANAPGWTIDDVWIDSFDYGIFGFNIGHINNIYITRCIITGHPSNSYSMHAGIHLANSVSSQINAIVIRDCEINRFDKGIIIGGTANSILQCCIQACNYGIYVDPSISGGTSGSPLNTVALTINGNYMEQINKNCIYIRASWGDNVYGLLQGMQITNNYLFKPSSADNSEAVIKLDPGTDNTYGPSPNGGGSMNMKFANVLIGMNNIRKASSCKAYDMKNCLGANSILMDANIGGLTDHMLPKPFGIGATLFIKSTKSERLNFNAYKWAYKADTTNGADANAKAEISADGTAVTIDANVELRIYMPYDKLVAAKCSVSADEYPTMVYMGACYRNASDGNLYKNVGMSNENLINDENAITSYGRGGTTLNQETTGVDIFTLPYQASKAVAWNDYSGFVLKIYPYKKVTISNIIMQWLY